MSTDSQPSDEQVTARAKQLLDQSVADLDPTIIHRLQRARLAALEVKPSSRSWMVLAGGLSMAAVVALTVTLWTKQPLSEHHPTPLIEDIDLVLSAENVELADDLEFFHWLADADTTG
jgi:negative regulator of sigma E activity